MWNEFSVILKPSSLGGIGVFAAIDIPKGSVVFTAAVNTRRMLVTDIPVDFLKYCVYITETECMCPERFDRMEIGWFLNHSFEPNISKKSETEVLSIVDIKKDDEILLDYNQLNEPQHLKEVYYK